MARIRAKLAFNEAPANLPGKARPAARLPTTGTSFNEAPANLPGKGIIKAQNKARMAVLQ